MIYTYVHICMYIYTVYICRLFILHNRAAWPYDARYLDPHDDDRATKAEAYIIIPIDVSGGNF